MKVKYKGLFEITKEFHKDHSFKIVSIALSEYFINDVPVVDVISNIGYKYIDHSTGKEDITNIFDYCGKHKTNVNCHTEIRYICGQRIIVENQQKVTRYLITRTGSSFFRVYTGGKSAGEEECINKGFNVTIFNQYVKKDDYDLNYSFYIRECNKVIESLNQQLKLL